MLSECNIMNISVDNAKTILAAIEFYANGVSSKQKKMIKLRKEDSLIEDLKSLKAKIEKTEVDHGINVKDAIVMSEEDEYFKLKRSGKTEEDLKGMFMYI